MGVKLDEIEQNGDENERENLYLQLLIAQSRYNLLKLGGIFLFIRLKYTDLCILRSEL